MTGTSRTAAPRTSGPWAPASVGPDLAERLAFVAGALNRRLRPPADALTHVALSALASIARAGEIRPGDLARVEGIAAPGMTRLVGELSARGLVDRAADPDDGRAHLVRLTAAGEAALSAAYRDGAAAMAAILGEVDADDRAALERAVGVLEAALLASPPTAARTA